LGAVIPMRALQKAIGVVNSYVAHPDPRVALANSVSLLVASNQPFYPLYLWWLVGGNVAPAFYTFLSTPFFLAVPAVSRINTIAGRALLPLAGIGNTLLCAGLFGVESGVEIFLIPCVVLALLLFRPRERAVSLVLAGLCVGALLVPHDHNESHAAAYTAEQYAAFLRLNAMSAGALTALVAMLFSRLLAALEKSAETAGGKEPR
jgi:hypothetical protein